MYARRLAVISALVLGRFVLPAVAADDKPPAWANAHLAPPMTADETKAFMERLARFVYDHHLKRDANSPQRGMVYEYFDVARKGQFDQWVQGEGLDTMHDGAWFAAALVNACRAAGDPFYRQFLTEWLLPFYCKMLNHSDELFVSSAKRNDAYGGAAPWGKVWAFQDGEKGFIPYFWDDGASVSLERRQSKRPTGERPCVDFLAGKPNPKGLLDGYSQGMSNHMAQDIGVMVQLAWLLLKDSDAPADRKLAADVAEAAKNLHACRMRHHGPIPMCVAPAALAGGDAELMKRVPDPNNPRLWEPSNHYTRALRDFAPGKQEATPGFADDQQYNYYYGTARAGDLPEPQAFRTVYDAYTEGMLYHYYSDDETVPPGINKFDLHPLAFVDGKPAHYRHQRKGPFGKPLPIGSRMGPQNMICCGWAIQALRARPGLWEQPYRRSHAADLRVYVRQEPALGPPWNGATAADTPAAEVTLDGTALRLTATRTALTVAGTAKGETKLTIFARPDGKGSSAVATVKADGVSAVNDRGEELEVRGQARKAGDTVTFEFTLPYTVAPGQKAWANGIEHGRYAIGVGKAIRGFYLASHEKDVAAWLTRELAGGLRTWRAIFDEKGYIPTGMGTGRFWDGFSDSGGYAHLLSAAAQWLLCLQGASDWKVHNIPVVLKEASR